MIRKLPLLITLIFVYSLFVQAQTNGLQKSSDPFQGFKFKYEEQCGNPIYESMIRIEVEGKVTKIINSSTLIIALKDKRQKRVELVAVDVPTHFRGFEKTAFNALTDLVLNKDVRVLVNPSDENSKSIIGIVFIDEKDINLAMIESGLARYKSPPAYSMSDYTACSYRAVEGEARKAKRGLWQSVSP